MKSYSATECCATKKRVKVDVANNLSVYNLAENKMDMLR